MTPQEYLEKRLYAAEKLIDAIVDLTKPMEVSQATWYATWKQWEETEPPAPVCPSQTHNFHIARHGKCQDCGGTEWMDAPAPTIGARWVSVNERLPKERELYHHTLGRDWIAYLNQDGTWTNEGREAIVTHWLDESPATFPTREQAMEWALETFIPHTERRTAALAMYDWIVQHSKR